MRMDETSQVPDIEFFITRRPEMEGVPKELKFHMEDVKTKWDFNTTGVDICAPCIGESLAFALMARYEKTAKP